MGGPMKGVVKNYYKEKGFGFITGENSVDVFVHFSSINMSGFKILNQGQLVDYDVVNSQTGWQATNVTVIQEQHVQAKPTSGERNAAIEHNTEDKPFWCKTGQKKEEVFIKEIVPKINRSIIIHPEKANNPKHIDLLRTDIAIVADLKTQNTPFFTAGKYYKCSGEKFDPQYTVTFNHKDYDYYSRVYPNSIIYWWVHWTQLQWKELSVQPMYCVYEVPFEFMSKLIQNQKVPLHRYQHRVGDPINAKDSYLFDLRWFERLL